MSPSQTNASLQELRTTFIAKGISSATSCYISHGKGAVLVDVEGNEYIDFAGGIAVMNVGHSHPKVVKAIQDQLDAAFADQRQKVQQQLAELGAGARF